jgi:hypothetical protein
MDVRIRVVDNDRKIINLKIQDKAVPAEKKRIELRGIVYKESDHWIAHCLELDIVAEGKTPAQAVSDAVDLCAFQIETAIQNNDLESIFRPAPSRFWNLFFSETRRSRVPKLPPNKPLTRFEARELVLA